MTLTEAGKAEILRAAQRDDILKEKLANDISELLQLCGGIQVWIKYKEIVNLGSRVLYDIVTTMLNLQTLGEEFTGMVQVNRTATSLPKKHRQFLMILFSNCGKKIIQDILQRCKKKIKSLPKNHSIQPSVVPQLIKLLGLVEILLPILEKTHKTLFYFNGTYYGIAKRLFGIRYVLVRYWLKDRTLHPAFRLLGIVSIAYIMSHLISVFLNFQSVNTEIEKHLPTTAKDNSVKSYEKCPLCLNKKQFTSVTPCGHLFCWPCIVSWLQEQPKCPICRQSVLPSRIVYLQNYTIDMQV